MKKLSPVSSAIIVIMLVVGTLPSTALAAANTLYLSPDTDSFEVGQTVSLELRIGPDTTTKGVKAHLEYDGKKLNFQGSYEEGGSFNNVTVDSSTDEELTVNAKAGTGDGDRLIVTLLFQAVASGDTEVLFSGTNQTLSYNLLIFPVWTDIETQDSTYSITKAPSSTQPSTPKNKNSSSQNTRTSSPSSPGSTSTKKREKKSIDFTLSPVKVINITDHSAQVEWTTSVPTSSKLFYKAADKEFISSITKMNHTKTHKIELARLRSNTAYTISVEATDKNENIQKDEVLFITKSVEAAALSVPATPPVDLRQASASTNSLSLPDILAPLSAIGVIVMGGIASVSAYQRRRATHSIKLIMASILITNHHSLRRFSKINV